MAMMLLFLKLLATPKKGQIMLLNQAIALLLVIIYGSVAAMATQLPLSTKPGCPNRCGNVNIPYPFGTHQGCYLDESFFIACNHSSNKPFLRGSIIGAISIDDGEVTVSSAMVNSCYKDNRSANAIELDFSPFTFSDTKNELVGVGCDTIALVGPTSEMNMSGCMSQCYGIDDVKHGSCTGKGCCQSTIPKGVAAFLIATGSVYNYTNVSSFSPCSYAFIVEKGKYNFSSLDLPDLQSSGKEIPLILDWSIGNITCDEARRNEETYACKDHSECYNLDNKLGYRCNCSQGYQGNPYLPYGCQDVEECLDPSLNRCLDKKSCKNTIGNYTCSCPKGRHGDGREGGEGCVAKQGVSRETIFGTITGVLVLLLLSSWTYFGLRRRRVIKLKEKYFQENGGYLFEQKISEHGRSSTRVAKIFTEKDLKKATDDFHDGRILGKGGQGTVYKGILPDNQIVAVKRSKIGDDTQVEGFINEVLILSQINHRNVVKLLGCCLETRVPLLVYEFVTNGTLFDHIHNCDGNGTRSMPWETRLKIAIEVAEALSYMHSAASTPIIHRDIKSANILLDKNYTAKVSDFGASKLIPVDKSELTTLVQGTLGYLDPEYLRSSQLTEKSDVYSFGVVIIELLTRKKPISFARREEDRNLATHFVTSIQENRLLEVLDHELVNKKNIEQLKTVALLAGRCVSLKGDERPTMKDVATELRGLSLVEKHPWDKSGLCAQEHESLLQSSLKKFMDASSSITTSDSVMKSMTLEIGDGR